MKNTKTNSLIKLSSIACLSAASLLIPSTSIADDQTGFSFSAYYGGYKSRGGEFEDENDLYEVGVGYRFLPFLGIEASYTDLGEFGGDDVSADVDGYSLSLVGTAPLTESFKIYGEVGQFFSNTEVNVLDFNEDFDDETLFYGVGVSFKVAEPLWINAEYQRYKVEVNDSNWPVQLDDEDTDVDAVKIGAVFNF
jgi:opacity protein-like surface antigen